MRPVSSRFLDVVAGSHRAVSQALIVAPGQTGTSPTGTAIDILSGDVQFDARAQVRAVLNMETSAPDGFPRRSDDLLTPYGNEVFVRRGVDYGGGAIEWVSLGYYRIDEVEQDEGPDGPIRLAAADRMQGVVDARITSPIQFGAAEEFGTVVESLIWPVWGWATIEWDDDLDDQPIGRNALADEDRYGFLNDLLTSRGKIWYWDHRGVLVIKDPPAATDPVWECRSGAGGVLMQLARGLSREGVFNAVAATGEAIDDTPPARALVVDDDPDSPTYWDGQFGRVPRLYASPFITTDVQAASAAASILRQGKGVPYQADFRYVPNPAIEPDDPIRITIGAREELHIIDKLTIPLAADQPQTGATRQQNAGLIIGGGV